VVDKAWLVLFSVYSATGDLDACHGSLKECKTGQGCSISLGKRYKYSAVTEYFQTQYLTGTLHM
jgi:hypothetical protein